MGGGTGSEAEPGASGERREEGERGGPGEGGDATAGGGVAARILSEMAHQLKNPMQAIAMNLEVLRGRISREAPELWAELEGYAAAVDRGVRQLDRRLRLVTALGRSDAEASAESVPLGSTVADLVEALRYDRDPPAVQVERRGEEGFEVRVRPGPLVELLYRLIAAARSRAGEGGVTVVVEAGEGDEVALTVSLGDAGDAPAGEDEGRWRALAERAGGWLEAGGRGRALARVTFPVG